jgi:hypothetical protein
VLPAKLSQHFPLSEGGHGAEATRGMIMGRVLELICFVGLAMQISPPMLGQDKGATGQGGDKQRHERKKTDAGSGKPMPVGVPLNAPDANDKARGIAAQDKEQSVKLTAIPPVTIADKQKTWLDYAFDWGPWVFSAMLVIVGIVGVVLARRTLGTMDRQANLMRTQATLMELQAELMRASMTQWVSVANWQAILATLSIPSSPGRKSLLVQFDIANESGFPLTAKADFRFFGKLPNAARFSTVQDVPLFPRKPYKCEVRLNLTEEQSKEFTDTALRISVHGAIIHVGIAKEQSPLMSISGNLVCGMNRPAYLEYENITMTPMAQQQGGAQDGQKAN